jgi:hypothetical protein
VTSSTSLHALAFLALTACGAPTVPEPKDGGDGTPRAVEVGHPPPAALPEIVPPAPSADLVWLDGHWSWHGRNWVWQRGGWLRPPAGAVLSPWKIGYERDGRLLFTDTEWLDARGQPIDEPELVLPAASPPTPRLSEDATTP